MRKLLGLVSGLVFATILVAWAWFGALPLRQASLEQNSAADIVNGASSIDRSATWPLSHHLVSGVANYLGLPLSARSGMDESTLARVRESGEAALSRRPLGVEGWVLLAELEKMTGNDEDALAYASVGGLIGDQHPKYLDRLLPLYIRLGDSEAAVATGAALLASVPAARDRVYSQLLWSGVPAERLVERFAPLEGVDARPGDADYWSSTLAYAIRSGQGGFADALWVAAPDKAGLLVSSTYPEFLARRGNEEQLQAVMRDTGTSSIHVDGEERLTFTSDATASLCWRLRAHRDAEYRVMGAGGVEPALELSFSNGRNTAFSHVSCLLAVPAEVRGASLVLRGQWQGRGLTTREGIYVEVVDARGGKYLNKRTERKFGDWPWQEFGLEFDVPEDVELLQVRIARRKTNNLDSRFFGTVSFRDIRIGPAADAQEVSVEALKL